MDRMEEAMSEDFSNEADFKEFVLARLRQQLRQDLAAPLAEAVVAGEAMWRAAPPAPGGTPLNLRIGRYFIRDDDLPVIDIIANAASALVAVDASKLSAAIPVLAGLATLAWNLWRKGLLLSRDDLGVLGELRRCPTMSVGELLPLVRSAGVAVDDTEALRRLLKRLTALETRDGTEITLAKEENGTWRALPV